MEKKTFLKLLLIVFAFIFLLCITIFFFKRNREKESIEVDTDVVAEEEENVEEEIVEQFTKVSDINTFYTVEKYIQDYYNYLAEGKYNEVYSLLDKSYIKDNEISKDNVNKKLAINHSVEFVANNMEYRENNELLTVYKVRGMEINREEKNKKDVFFIVKFDWDINKYSISSVNNFEIEIKMDNSINKESDFNSFEYITLSDVEEANYYYRNLKSRFLFDQKSLYDCLNKDYLENKLNNSYDEFEKKFNEIKNDIIDSQLIKYKIDYIEDTIVYKLIDSNDICYELTVQNAMDYKLNIK